MPRALRSELIRMKRPSFSLVGLGLMALFGSLGTFIAFSSAGQGGVTGPAVYFPTEAALAAPDGFATGLALASQLIGILALSLWAIAVASDYSTGLIRLLAQAEPSRTALLVGKFAALVLVTAVGTLLATLAAYGTAQALGSSFVGDTSAWSTDTLANLLEAYRNLTLSALVWGVFGFTIATVSRSSGAAIAGGIGWVVVFEVMLQGVAGDVADMMPGAMLTALAAGGSPTIEFETALALAAVYTVAGVAISSVIAHRREITF